MSYLAHYLERAMVPETEMTMEYQRGVRMVQMKDSMRVKTLVKMIPRK